MGKPWSEKRYLAVAVKRMKAIKSGKATTRFWMGRVAEFKNMGITYRLGLFDGSIELSADKGNKELFVKKIRGKAFEDFLKNVSEWLHFPMGYVVYRKNKNSR